MAFGGFHAQSTDHKLCEQFRLQQATDAELAQRLNGEFRGQGAIRPWPQYLPRPGQARSVADAIAALANEQTINPVEIDWLSINKEFS